MKYCLIAFALCLSVAANADHFIEIRNPGFEHVGKDGRIYGWSKRGDKFRAEPNVGHSLTGGLVWESSNTTSSASMVRQYIKGFEKGDLVEMSALIYKENFKDSGDGAVLSISWKDSSNQWISASYAVSHHVKDGEWTEIKGSGAVPLNAEMYNICIYVSEDCTGKVIFDNIAIRVLDKDPITFMASSCYRDLAADGKVTFNAVLDRRSAAEKGSEVVFVWKDKSGKIRRTPAANRTEDSASITLEVADLAMGRQSVSCEFVSGGKTKGAAKIDFTRVDRLPDRHVWIDSRHRCIVDGKPFFPLGMYWSRPDAGPLLDRYAKGPFNCMMPYPFIGRKDLDRIHALGLKTFSCLGNVLPGNKFSKEIGIKDNADAEAYVKRHVEEVQHHPALLGWYVMDEAWVGDAGKHKWLYDLLRKFDDHHPAYAVQDRTYDLRFFMPCADVFGLDPYPINKRPIGLVTQYMREAHKAFFGSRPFWCVPQAYNRAWYNPKLENQWFPTVEEMRSINWQHIAGGANGLISFAFYAMYKANNKDRNQDECWRRICVVNEEIRRMIPVLLSVESAPQAVDAPKNLPVRTWVKDGKLYVLACNTETAPLKAEVKLSYGSWKTGGTEVGAGASIKGGNRIVYDLPPIGVSLVRFDPAQGK